MRRIYKKIILLKIPRYLYHYYERENGPFQNLSDLPSEQAEIVLSLLRERDSVFASKRSEEYLEIRRHLENQVRQAFIRKGGEPRRERPHYMTLGECPWLLEWYKNGCEIKIPISKFEMDSVSLTYGDLFPAMRYKDNKPYSGRVYLLSEIEEIIKKYGLPQERNRNGELGPKRYIEVQVWDDESLREYLPVTGRAVKKA